MLFEPNDWELMIQSLVSKTRDQKLTWKRTDESQFPGSSHLTLSASRLAFGIGDYNATVGSNSFRLGSSDGDGRPPHFLRVTRVVNGDEVTDTLRSDAYMGDPQYARAAAVIPELARAVGAQQVERARAASSIISDLEDL